MKLEQALDELDKLGDEDVVFAKRPWTLDSEALIGQLDANMRVPQWIADQQFKYFLEVPVAKEVLEVFASRRPTLQQRRELLLYYAENDAYPSWVYQT